MKAEPLVSNKQKPVEVSDKLINELHFPKEDVLNLNFDKNQREKDLQHAVILGSVYKTKVSVLFEDIEGLKKVTTTVEGITSSSVNLDQNANIPIHRVVRIYY